MYRAELYLTDYEHVRLDEFRFSSPQSQAPLITVNGGSSSYCIGASKNLFTWTAGVRAVTALLLKAALKPDESVSICGGPKTLAATLDYSLSKEPEWIIDFFGMTSRGSAVARTLFGRRNSERKRAGPVEIYLNDSLLKGSGIQIFLNRQRATMEQIASLLSALGEERPSEKDQSLPSEHFPLAIPAPAPLEPDFPISYIDRTLSLNLDFDLRIAFVTLQSHYLNIGTKPLYFVHYNIRSGQPDGPQNIHVSSPDDPALRWETVQSPTGTNRVLVTFSTPLRPGASSTDTIFYEFHNYDFQDSRLEHLVRAPTRKLTLQVSCTTPHAMRLASIVAEENDCILFGSLPRPKIRNAKSGQSSATWTMQDPPPGYRFQLYWGVELRDAITPGRSRSLLASPSLSEH